MRWRKKGSRRRRGVLYSRRRAEGGSILLYKCGNLLLNE